MQALRQRGFVAAQHVAAGRRLTTRAGESSTLAPALRQRGFAAAQRVAREEVRSAPKRASSNTSRPDVEIAREQRHLARKIRRLSGELDAARAEYESLAADSSLPQQDHALSPRTSARRGLWKLRVGAQPGATAAAAKVLDRRFSGKTARRRRMRILSLDGGGARGIFTALILARLAHEEPRLFDNIDVIAGTSSGAVIGSLLACGVSPAEVAQVFEHYAPEVFHAQPWWRRMASPLLHSHYGDARSEIFREWTQDMTLADLKPWLLVTTFRIGKSEFFKCRRLRRRTTLTQTHQ